MKPSHVIITFVVTTLFLISLVAGPFAFAGLLLLGLIVGGVVYVQAMNRQQQQEAQNRARQCDPDASSAEVHTDL
jgi:hypothetical protein